MKETANDGTSEKHSRARFVAVRGSAVLLLGFITYFIVVQTQDAIAIASSNLPLGLRVGEFIFPAILLLIGLWFVLGLIRLRRRAVAPMAAERITALDPDSMVHQDGAVDAKGPVWKGLGAAAFCCSCAIFVTCFARGPENHRTSEQIIVVLFMWLAVAFMFWNAFRRRETKPGTAKSGGARQSNPPTGGGI